jgi:poly(3-hydroxybutyrate) depolymerase/peptidoglycan/LPS O-acetylase OafA/YrhL
MTQPARRPRVVAFDLVRLLIICLVVSVHVLANVPATVTPVLGAFITVFHTSRELFFLLTAFVLAYNYGHRPRVRWLPFWWRRYLLVVPAYVAWSVIYFAADNPRLHPLSAALHTFTHDLETGDARYHLYFLLVTMQMYLAFPLLRWLLRRTEGHHRAVFVTAFCYQVAFTIAVHYNLHAPGLVGGWLRAPAEWLPSYLLYVIGGGLAAWHFDPLAAFTRRHTRAALLTMAAGVCAGMGTYCAELLIQHQPPLVASTVFQPVLIAETLAFAWGLLATGLRWSDRGAPGRRLAAAGADCSFGIYLVHPLVLQGLVIVAADAGVLTTLRHAPAAIEVAVLLGIVVPVIYATSWVIAFVLRRTPLSLTLTGRPWVKVPLADLSRWVRPGLAMACVAIIGAGLWAARTAAASATSSPPVRIAKAVQPAAKGSVPVIQSTYSMKSGGLTRQWVQLAPAGTLPAADPIIVVLSGINATTKLEIARDHLTSYVQAGEAELVYPAGYERSWNAGGCCGKAAKAGVNDVAFIEALVASVDPGHHHPLDLVGYSNGGRLAYRISCTDPSLVNQIAVVKAMPQPGCEPAKPVTLLQVDSTDDKQVPYQPGDKGKESPPATVQVARLETLDRCSAKTTKQTRGIMALTTWPDCADGTRLAFAVYHGGGHSFPQASGATPSAAAVIWAFFNG